MRPSVALVVLALLGVWPVLSVHAADWPRFLGPHQNATSDETGLVREFPEGGPPVLWTVAIGEGYGGAAVRDGQVFLHDRVRGEADRLRVFDLESGEELWGFEYEAPGRLDFAGSRCVPTVEEDLVYVQGGLGQLYCIDRESQDAVWNVDLPQDYGAENPGYGWCQAPLVYEDLVIVAPMAEDAGLVAMDRFTGDESWRTPALGMSHSTPVLMRFGGEPQVVFLSAVLVERSLFAAAQETSSGLPPTRTLLSSFDPRSGELLWQTEAYNSAYPIPVPIQLDEEHVFCTSGYASGSSLLKLLLEGESPSAEAVFHHPKGSQVHVPLRVGDHLYLMANENDNHPAALREQGGLMCLDLQGTEKWRTGDAPFFGRGSMIHADGMLIIQDGLNGILRLVEPSPEGYRPLAEANLFGFEDRRDHQLWAPLALADGRLLLRSQEELKCVDLRTSGT